MNAISAVFRASLEKLIRNEIDQKIGSAHPIDSIFKGENNGEIGYLFTSQSYDEKQLEKTIRKELSHLTIVNISPGDRFPASEA